MAWGAAGAVLGSLIGAGGQIGGGLLSGQNQPTNADLISPQYNPYLELALQAGQFDSLNALGFGDINNVPGPAKQLIGQFQASPLDTRTKRRATNALNTLLSDPSLLENPYGRYSTEEINKLLAGGSPPAGRVVFKASGKVPEGTDRRTLPIKSVGRLEQGLAAAGMSFADLKSLIDRQNEYKAQLQRLNDAGLGKLNEDTILARFRAANNASQIIGDAANYASTGVANGAVQPVLEQDKRNLERFATRAGLQAQFGGASQAAAQKAISDAQLDQNLRVLEHALGISTAIQGALSPGTQGVANQSQQALNAASIAAQQAAAANSLRAAGNSDRSLSFGNAIGSATSTLGTMLSNQSAWRQLGGDDSSLPTYENGMYGPGSTANQIATDPSQIFSSGLFGSWR